MNTDPAGGDPLTFKDILAARQRLNGIIYRTPIVYSGALSDRFGCTVYLKLESQQKTAAFKVRGACNKVLSLSAESQARGLITASSGNHAQGVAFAARLCGIDSKTTIAVPRTTPATKINNTRAYGHVKVELVGDNYDEASVYAHHLAELQGAVYIEPYNDWAVMAGQGTLGLELIEDLPDVDTVIVPVGGGGLISGVAMAIKTRSPQTKVFGVRAPGSRLADGIRVKAMGDKTRLVIERYVDELCLVEDSSIEQAIIELAELGKVIAEGAGAVGLAALLSGQLHVAPGSRIALVISGANIDSDRLGTILCTRAAPALAPQL